MNSKAPKKKTNLKPKPAEKPVGAVLVVGGGIAGIQSSIDLADSGYKVYLVEKSPTIGGVMAQLDKTFPTNDCSMCILSPKLVECGRHLNIETMTYSEVKSITGSAGNFDVEVLKRSRYIDPLKCTGCGDCAEACPVVSLSEFDEKLAPRKATYRPFPQAYPNVFAIEKAARPPCGLNCPAGINVQGYVALISKGAFDESLALIREAMPFPSVCGRVCPHPCEQNCRRGEYDKPVSIKNLKRFVFDEEMKRGDTLKNVPQMPEAERYTEKVAVIGSGPAGLACAYDLAKKGYPVTVFEKLPVAGGMMYVGIPEYRLPKKILNLEIERIKEYGVSIELNSPIGGKRTLDSLRKEGYKAFFVAVGAHVGYKLGIDGENTPGVYDSVEFLRNVALGNPPAIGKKVAVIGGGNSALDAARTALRMGVSEANIVYRRTRAEMPAFEEEIVEAEHEGIVIRYLEAPVRVLGKDRVEGLECISMELGEPDDSGRRRPVPKEGTEHVLDIDTIITAISQQADTGEFAEKDALTVTRWGTFEADSLTARTNIPDVFAGGDAVTGPATVVEGIGWGRKAAESIDRFLRGKDLRESRETRQDPYEPRTLPRTVPFKQRTAMPLIPVEERKGSYDEVELGFTAEMAVEEAKRCLNCGICSECMACVRACKAQAVNHAIEEETVRFKAGSVILAPGFEEFDASLLYDLGYSRFPDVVTSIEFERILSASGPFRGHVKRPSDGIDPVRIAWIQCVGSRDQSCGAEYCSSVCCMYAIKEAMIAKEHAKHVKPTVFFMDMRAYGKDFDKYYERAKGDYGIVFKRSRVNNIFRVESDKPGGSMRVQYVMESGEVSTEDFDMVVLSVGLRPPAALKDLSGRIGLGLNGDGFIRTGIFDSLSTNIPGIYACGAATGPKDIPETVVEASAAASKSSMLLVEGRGTLTVEKTYPAERDISKEPPRIGVFICHCGINIGAVVSVPDVVDYAKTLPFVAYAEQNLYTCSQDTQKHIVDMVHEHGLNRVIVASCSPRTHEPLFQETIREAGLNPYLFEMVNIRDQCSWVHKDYPGEATEKSKDLVRMTVYKSRFLEPLYRMKLGVNSNALVVGGGVSGMSAALALAEQNFQVILVEREPELGGNARNLHISNEVHDVDAYLGDLIGRVEHHPKITLYKHSEIVGIDGYIGNFTTRIRRSGSDVVDDVEHGAVIVAVGAKEYNGGDYLLGASSRVMTLARFGEMLANGKKDEVSVLRRVVMIQCVGSRNEEHPYCSRVCCTTAVRNALLLKDRNPDAEIIVLYRDIRTYGYKEHEFAEARGKGIVFVRFEDDAPPVVKETGNKLTVTVRDPILGRTITFEPDILALSAGIVPDRHRNEELAQMLKVPLNDDGFFLEAHVKLRPVDFATEGIFVCGLAHAPKNLQESISQAHAAASRASVVLSKKEVEADGKIARVNEQRCVACGMCEAVCPYGAVAVNKEKMLAEVNAVLCKGCGNCSSACRSGAIDVMGFSDEQIFEAITSF